MNIKMISFPYIHEYKSYIHEYKFHEYNMVGPGVRARAKGNKCNLWCVKHFLIVATNTDTSNASSPSPQCTRTQH